MPVESTRVVPVFPLPDTVFFPHTLLALHIFEPRYRVLVHDVMAGDRLIAVTLMRPPDFCSIGTVGRVGDLQPLPDGRFNLQLKGLERVAFTEITTDKPYRMARAEPRPEPPVDPNLPGVRESKLELLASLGYLMRELSDPGARALVLDDRMPFNVAVNAVCAGLPLDASLRQELLEEDDLLRRRERVAAHLQDVLEVVARLDAERPGTPRDGDLN